MKNTTKNIPEETQEDNGAVPEATEKARGSTADGGCSLSPGCPLHFPESLIDAPEMDSSVSS